MTSRQRPSGGSRQQSLVENTTSQEKPKWWNTRRFSCFVDKRCAAASGRAVRSGVFGRRRRARLRMKTTHETASSRSRRRTETGERTSCQGSPETPLTWKRPSHAVSATNSGSWRQWSGMSRVTPLVSQCREETTSTILIESDTPTITPDILDGVVRVPEKQALGGVYRRFSRQGSLKLPLTALDMEVAA